MNGGRTTDGVFASVCDAIGGTPLVALDRLTSSLGLQGRLLAKLEFLNPDLSKKDRAARQIINEAERDGTLAPGQPVIELTSGNMGTGLAIVCAVRGHPFIAVMSQGNSVERARMMQALGAEVVLVAQAPGGMPGQVSGADLALVEEETQRLTALRGAFRADQFRRGGSWRAHFEGTAEEIWRQCGGRLTAFCDFVGSGGTLGGCSRYFKRVDPAIRCYGVEPQGAAVLAGLPVTDASHPIQGGGYCQTDLPLIDHAFVDGFLQVAARDARDMARRLAQTEGIFGSYSAGANVAAGVQQLRSAPGSVVAVLICDSGLKYLSTDLWRDLP